jgi:hypothetical protein
VALSTRSLAIVALLSLPACATRSGPPAAPAPASPEAAVTAFLSAVDSASLPSMAALWGTDRGPSTAVIRDARQREQRLVVMQRLLQHDAFRFVPASTPAVTPRGRRQLQVELTRGDRRAVVPFTVVGQRAGGWLVESIGLEAAMPLSARRPGTP